MANQGKRMVKENLIAEIGKDSVTDVKVNGTSVVENTVANITIEPAPTYTAGTGIDITSNVISVDGTIATKTYVDNKTIPTYGLEWEGAASYDTRYTMQYDFQTLIDAGMPIIGQSSETELNYPENYIVLDKGSIFKVKGYFAIKRQTGGYQVFAAADKSSNRLNQYYAYNVTKTTNRIIKVDNARANAILTFSPTAEEIALGVSSTIIPLTGTANTQTAISAETADDSYYSLKAAYLTVSLAHPTPNTRYDNQMAVPSDMGGFLYAHATSEVLPQGTTQFEWLQPSTLPKCPSTNPDGTYVLEATVASGVVTYAWVLKS